VNVARTSQIAITKVFAEAGDYDRKRPAIAWALAIAAWECQTLQRRQQRLRREPLNAADELASQAPDPEETAGLRKLHDAARAVLRELSLQDQETLLAAFSEDAKDRLTTGVTFRKRKERALNRLRAAWRKAYGR
jgi:DNA-directed RNA polymerase specialized sigma24 family protein